MSALAEQHLALMSARSRLGLPVTPVKRISRNMVPAAPVLPEPVAKPEPPTPEPVKPILIPRAHWSSILREVSAKHNIDARTLLGSARYRDAVLARNEAFYRIRHEVRVNNEPMSYPEIGRRFGKDHTSVIHGVRRHQSMLDAGENQATPVNPDLEKIVGCGRKSPEHIGRPPFQGEVV